MQDAHLRGEQWNVTCANRVVCDQLKSKIIKQQLYRLLYVTVTYSVLLCWMNAVKQMALPSAFVPFVISRAHSVSLVIPSCRPVMCVQSKIDYIGMHLTSQVTNSVL
jgi:hypothetical protein